jgi:hypothetical protein
LLYLAQLSVAIVAFVPFGHLVLLAMAKGLFADVGAFLIGLIGLGSLCGRVLPNWIAEAGGSCRSAAICAVVMGVALAGLALFPDPWGLGCDAVLLHIGIRGCYWSSRASSFRNSRGEEFIDRWPGSRPRALLEF